MRFLSCPASKIPCRSIHFLANDKRSQLYLIFLDRFFFLWLEMSGHRSMFGASSLNLIHQMTGQETHPARAYISFNSMNPSGFLFPAFYHFLLLHNIIFPSFLLFRPNSSWATTVTVTVECQGSNADFSPQNLTLWTFCQLLSMHWSLKPRSKLNDRAKKHRTETYSSLLC